MERIKTFLIYILLIIGAYILFSFLAFGFITNTYKNIKKYEILETSPSVQISESKATYINGYIIGKVTNNTDALIHSDYIKFNFYNKRNSYLGSKYVKLESFQVGRTFEFKLNFELTGVEHYTVEFTKEEEIQDEVQDNTPLHKFLALSSIIIILYYIL